MDPILWNRDVISCLFWGTFLSAESEMKSDYSRSYGGSSSDYSASEIQHVFVHIWRKLRLRFNLTAPITQSSERLAENFDSFQVVRPQKKR